MTVLISYPGIAANAVSVEFIGTELGASLWEDCFSGARASRTYLQAIGSVLEFGFDMGTGNAIECDHIIISQIADLVAEIDDVEVESSAGDLLSVFTNRATFNAASISAGLLGPNSNDFIYTFTSVSARSWRIRFNTVGATDTFSLGKIHLGKLFDLGREPIYTVTKNYDSRSVPFTTSGAVELSSSAELRHEFELNWEAITDAKLEELESFLVLMTERDRLFLYTSANHQILNNQRLVHSRIDSIFTENPNFRINYNNVTGSFKEDIG